MNQPHPLAKLKHKNGLGWWDWVRPEDGVRQIVLTGEGCLSDARTESLAGEFLTDSHYEVLLRPQDGDVDVYKPRVVGALDMLMGEVGGVGELSESRLLLSIRRKRFDAGLCSVARDSLRAAAFPSRNRGAAAGKVDPEKMKRDPSLVLSRGNTANYYTQDGLLSNASESNQVNSGIVGYFNATPRNPYCRQTAYTRDNADKFAAAMPFLEEVNRAFRDAAPARWGAQNRYVSDETGLREKGWLLGDTVFSTVTVNKNYRTGCHRDAGDYHPGFGNLTVFEGSAHRYAGGYTVFPKFRCAVDLREGDFIGMDVHEWHGNTEMTAAVPGEDDWERVSLVCYVRVEMTRCGTHEEEERKREEGSKTWRNPVRQHAFRLEEDRLHQEGLAYTTGVLFSSEEE
jgi:hypothetical protein